MEDAPKWNRKKLYWSACIAALATTAGFLLWWRMGGIIVETAQTAPQLLNRALGEPREFTICTYNVQARPFFDETRRKFGGISPLLNRFDICALQECFKDHERIWAQASHAYKIYHSALRHPFKAVGSGLSLLANFPLLATQAINFDAVGEFQNKPASKGVLMARFDVNGMALDVYTTHIEAGKSPAAMKAREGQGEEIVAFIRDQSPPQNNVILLGDFNMRPSRGPEDKEANKNNAKVYVFDRIKEQLAFRDASDEFNGPVGKEIDRILFRPGTQCAMEVRHWQHDDPAFYHADQSPMSDHEPVFVTFALSRS